MKYLVSGLLLWLAGAAFAGDSLRLRQTLYINARVVQADNLGNLYVITPQNDIQKYGIDGRLKFTQNYKLYGKPASLDVSNPLELYVFYPEANTVLYLDNTLAERGKTDLAAGPFGQVTAICRSYDNGLWVWDQADLQLKKCTKEQQQVLSSGNPLQQPALQRNVMAIADNGQQVYVCDSNHTAVYDVFASYRQSLPTCLLPAFAGQAVYCLTSIGIYNLITGKPLPVSVHVSELISVAASGSRIVLVYPARVEVWE